MRKDSIKRGKRVALVALLLSVFGMQSALARLEGRWIHHPAATLRSESKESQVDRIIDGDRYVYFCVRGALFNRSKALTYTTIKNIDPLQLFRYDKTLPWNQDNIRAVAHDHELSGSIVNVVNYSPRLGLLAVTYDNNAIDFIYDDGRKLSSQALADLAVPGQTATPYSITFDEELPVAYIAGSYGYAAVNVLTGELEEAVKTDKPVSWAGRVGDRMVLFAGDKISPQAYSSDTYIFPLHQVPPVLTAPVASGDALQVLMPLSGNTFAALAPNGADTNSVLKLFTINENRLSGETLAEGLTVDGASGSNFRHMFRTDGFVNPTADGYAVHSINNIYLLKRGTTKDEVLKSTVSKSALNATEKSAKASTYDGKRLWLYKYDSAGIDASVRGFYSFDMASGARSDYAAPSAPSCTFSSFVSWNPKYGAMFRGTGGIFDGQEPDVDRLAGYKDGKWTEFSYAANNSAFNLPTNAANYIGSDPVNPDWIWGNKRIVAGGLFRIDLSDYTNFLDYGSTNYPQYKTTYPGYFPVVPWQDWNAALNFTNIDFDNDSTMWVSRYMYSSPDGWYDSGLVKNAMTPIYYLTADERRAMANIGSDQSKLQDILGKAIVVKRSKLDYEARLIALKAPQNKNLILICHGSIVVPEKKSFIYDHRGTLDDQSDDRIAYLDQLYDEDGVKVAYENERSIYEDPKTGEVWLCTQSGPYIINPADMFAGSRTVRRIRISGQEGVDVDENPLEHIYINNMESDFMGRKWLATEQGLYCLSESGDEVLGWYTVENSQLPSNNVFNVLCTPEGVVFATTDRGIAEFRPEGSFSSVPAGSHLTVWPAAVTPEYKGYVTVTGAEEGSEYAIYDKEGNPKVELGRPDMGVFQWLPAGLEPGRYNIRRTNQTESNPLIILE